jgi:hypothetical protein
LRRRELYSVDENVSKVQIGFCPGQDSECSELTACSNNADEYSKNIVTHLSLTDNGKFKWNDSFENLSTLIDNLLYEKSIWSSSGGDCKKLDLSDLTVRWYQKTKSLTISGERSEDFKSQLRCVIELANTTVDKHLAPNNNSEESSVQQNVDDDFANDFVNEAMSGEIQVLYNNTIDKPEDDPESYQSDIACNQNEQTASVLVRNEMQSLEERLQQQIDKLERDFQGFKSKSAVGVQDHSTALKKENLALREENATLTKNLRGCLCKIRLLIFRLKNSFPSFFYIEVYFSQELQNK